MTVAVTGNLQEAMPNDRNEEDYGVESKPSVQQFHIKGHRSSFHNSHINLPVVIILIIWHCLLKIACNSYSHIWISLGSTRSMLVFVKFSDIVLRSSDHLK